MFPERIKAEKHGIIAMDKQAAVFVLIIAAAVTAVYAGLFVLHLSLPLLAILLLILAAVASFTPQIIELKEYERGVLFTLGKFQRVLNPGWTVIIPNFQSVEKVDLRTQVLDIHPQNVITQEQIRLKVDAVVYLRIKDPYKCVVEIKNYNEAVTHIIHSEIRNIIGKMTVEEVIARTEEIGAELFETLKNVETQWGISTQKVEIQSIELPHGLAEAMQKRREATEYKQKLETEAEARQVSIDILDRAASKMSDKTLTYLYLDALKRIADGKANKIIFPLELTRLANTLATGGKGGETDYPKIAESLIAAYREQQKRAIDSKLPFAKKKPENEAGEEAQTEMDEAQQKLAAEQESEAEEGQVGAKEAQPAEEVEAAAPMKKARLTRKKPEPGRNKAGKRWSVKAVKEKSKRAAGRKRVRR